LDALERLGDRDHAYAGLVRATFEVHQGMPWEDAFGPEDGSSGDAAG
jgi:hypothetical protein